MLCISLKAVLLIFKYRIAGNFSSSYGLRFVVLKSEVCEFDVCGLLTQYCHVLPVKSFAEEKFADFLKTPNHEFKFPANISGYTVSPADDDDAVGVGVWPSVAMWRSG